MVKSKLREYEFNASTKTRNPSLVGFVAPGLRFNVDKYVLRTMKNIAPEKKAIRAFNMIQEYQDDFNYEGKYHIPPHFLDVEQRFLSSLKYLAKFGLKVDNKKITLAKIFARTHDIIHNAGKEEPYFMTVVSIAKLYGIDVNDRQALEEIKESINFGLKEDNDICQWDHEICGRQSKFVKRPLVDSYTSKIFLSDEEMSGVVADAVLYTCGFAASERRIIWGWIQATEFARSLTPEGNPGIKFPRTQYELIAKLADMGSFYGSIEEWLRLSVDFILENAKAAITTPFEFIEFEYNFFRNFVQPILRLENLPNLRVINCKDEKAIVPEVCIVGMQDKLRYLDQVRKEFGKFGNSRFAELVDRTGNVYSEVKESIGKHALQFLDLIGLDLVDEAVSLPLSEPVSIDI